MDAFASARPLAWLADCARDVGLGGTGAAQQVEGATLEACANLQLLMEVERQSNIAAGKAVVASSDCSPAGQEHQGEAGLPRRPRRN